MADLNGGSSSSENTLREKFQGAIVEEISKGVLPETSLGYSYIQGKSRLCKVIQEKINAQACEKNHGVQVMGVYGMGGIGKTSICKALCDEYHTRFRGRVCHAELERKSKAELLREVLKRLTDLSHELLDGWNEDALLRRLNGGAIKGPVFLVVDNVSDTQESIDEAKIYLSAGLPSGSIVMMTAQSKATLLRVRPDVTESHVLEMPELDVEEAKSLFCRSSELELRGEADDGVVQRCVERCRFRKGDGSDSYQYHPLTLDVLGKQLGCIDPKEWEAHLDKIDEDILNQSGEKDHPIFSVLRKSYDVLSSEDQLLLMDVALFLPSSRYGGSKLKPKLNLLEWLGMVRGTSVDDVVSGLARLRRKSLLERLSVDGIETTIGMHDLWRAFCKAEVQSGELRCRRWVSGAVGCEELIDSSPAGTCWENVQRMTLFGIGVESTLERVNFANFSNVTVLKVVLPDSADQKDLVLDLSGLARLKSLELEVHSPCRLVVRGLRRPLVFLRITSSCYDPCNTSASSLEFGKQVGYQTELQHLELDGFSVQRLPDMKRMVSLRVAMFYSCDNVAIVAGLGRNLSNLRVLHFFHCPELRRCPGVGDLIALEELKFRDCRRLQGLPNLGKLRNLGKLNVSGCPLINELLGLGDVVALEELSVRGMERLKSLPNLAKLTNLRKLDVSWCPLITDLLALGDVVALEELSVREMKRLKSLPNLAKLTNLRKLDVSGCRPLITDLLALGDVVALEELSVREMDRLKSLPNLAKLTNLRKLDVSWCPLITDLLALGDVVALEELSVRKMKRLKSLPNLGKLTNLRKLDVYWCPLINELPGLGDVIALEELDAEGDSEYEELVLPDMSKLGNLRVLRLRYRRLEAIPGFESLISLQTVDINGWSLLQLTELNNLPVLRYLTIRECTGVDKLPDFEGLICLQGLFFWDCGFKDVGGVSNAVALKELVISNCKDLERLPDFRKLTRLKVLKIDGCAMLRRWDCRVGQVEGNSCGPDDTCDIAPDFQMPSALRELLLSSCNTLEDVMGIGAFSRLETLECRGLPAVIELPDLSNFPGLTTLGVRDCESLRMLTAREPIHALSELEVERCSSLTSLPDLSTFPGLLSLALVRCRGISSLSTSEPMTALKWLILSGFPRGGVKALSDLGIMFPALRTLVVDAKNGCERMQVRVGLTLTNFKHYVLDL